MAGNVARVVSQVVLVVAHVVTQIEMAENVVRVVLVVAQIVIQM